MKIFLLPAVSLALMGSLLISGSAQVPQLGFSFTDQVGDGRGSIDLIGMDFTFDNTSGAYTARLFATPENPFKGTFRVNLSLFDADTGSLDINSCFFQHTMVDYSSLAPTTELTLNGVSTRLLNWDAGDRVAISGPHPIGMPTGIGGFSSGVYDLPWNNVYDDIFSLDPGFYRNISAVPEPTAYALVVGIGLIGFGVWKRSFAK